MERGSISQVGHLGRIQGCGRDIWCQRDNRSPLCIRGVQGHTIQAIEPIFQFTRRGWGTGYSAPQLHYAQVYGAYGTHILILPPSDGYRDISHVNYIFATSHFIRQSCFHLPFCALTIFRKRQKPMQASLKTVFGGIWPFSSTLFNAILQYVHKNTLTETWLLTRKLFYFYLMQMIFLWM